MNRKRAEIPLLRAFLPVMALAGTLVLGTATVHAVQKYQYSQQLCTDCHGMPPGDSNVTFRNVTTGAVRGNHLTHATSAQSSCEKCHNGSSTFTSEHSDGFIHMSSNINASPSPAKGIYSSKGVFFNQTSNPVLGTCSNVNCHFEKTTPTWGGATFGSPADCGQCHGAPPAGSAGAPGSAGSHAKHDSYYTGASQCIKCHTDHTAEANTFAHATSLRNIAVTPRDPSNVAGGSYSGSGASFLPSQSAGQTFGTCSNLYCHSQGKSTSSFTGAGNAPKVTPIWGATPPLAANCAGCHGGTAAAGFNAMTSGKHPHHIIAAAKGYSFTCNYCHFDTTSDGTNVTDRTKHVNGSKDVAFGTPTIRVSTSTWNGTECANVYCHGNGQSLTPTVTTAWTGTITDCNGCHNHATIASGSHSKHIIDSSSCQKCHSATVSGLNIDYTLHLNRSVDIKLNAGFSENSPTYNGASISSDYQKTPGTAYARCSGLYCHSDGKRGAAYRTYSSKLWGSASLGCNGCHGTSNSSGAPGYTSGTGYENSHAKHVGGAADCVKCHFRTTADGTSVIGGTLSHIDGTIKVNLSKVSAFTTYSGIYDSSTRTCSSTYCHGGSSSSPSWGGSTTCTTCHKADSNLPGAHALHIQAGAPTATSYTVAPGNVSSAATYQFTCASCHGNNVSNHGNGPVASGSDATIFFGFSSAGRNPSYSRSGTINTDGQGFKWMDGAAGACGATYCHSNGAGGNGINTTFTWASASGSIGCKGCHDGAGASTALSGKHLKHIDTSTYGFTCNYCHYDTTSNGSTITDKSLHVNKSKDVGFDPWIRTTSSASSWNGSQCANVYCHGNGQSLKSTDTVPVSWAISTDCWSCHAYPNLTSGSHAKHVVNVSSCAICHNDSVNPALASIKSYSLHNNRYVDIKVGAPGVAETTSTYNGANIATANYQKTPGTTTATCTNLYCHSDGTWVWLGGSYTNTTPQWGNAGSTTCYSCHGNSKSYYTGTDWRKAFPLYSSYPDRASRKTNSHQHHADVRASNAGPQCRHCHYKVVTAAANDSTTDAAAGIIRHANGFYNVSGSGSNVTYKRGDDATFVSGGTPANVTFNYSYNAKPTASTCSSVSCHPSALSGTPNVAWSNRHDCSNCHKVDLKDTSGYHHAMNNYSTGNLTYPSNAPTGNADGTGGATYSTNRRCTMCHVNHDIFSPMLNPNSANRSYNLRTAIGTVPTVSSGYTNTDFIQKNGVGGICVSCHTTPLTKSSVLRKPENSVGTPTTLAIVYADYSAAIVNGHNYAIGSAMKNDGGSFSANCSKCHNGRKGETGVFSQMTTAVHDNSNRFMFASLQADYTQGLYIANLCMRCHHNSTDAGSPGGGAKKARANYDYYGSQAMNSASQSVWNLFSSGRNKGWNVVGTSNRFGHNVLFAGYTSHIPSYTQENGADIASHKHVTCTDCHNPHGGRQGDHAAGNTTLAPVLQGTDGVSVSWAAGNWTTSGTSYSGVASATAEYQICFKCHSGSNTNVTSWATTNSAAPSGAQAWTDLGLEFNPNNESYHPIAQALPATGNRQLASGALTGGWAPGMVMTCSDCHATDSTSSKGPHGSSVKWMLNPNTTGTKYYNWPFTTAAGNGSTGSSATLLTGTGSSTVPTANFCFSCHVWGGGGPAHTNRSSDHDVSCVGCHIRVPHGGKAPRLLTGPNAPARYKPDGNGGGTTYMNGAVRPASGTIGESSCNTASGCTEHSNASAIKW